MSDAMRTADSFWFGMDEPTNLMIITAFMTFGEPLDFRRLQATIEARLSVFPRFRMRVVRPVSGITAPRWESIPDFDVRSHVHRRGLPAPGDKAALQELVSGLMNTPLDPTRPLWEAHLIENYGRGCVVLFRIHHCIADGIALVHVMLAAADREPDAPWPDAPAAEPASGRTPPPPLAPVAAALDGVKGALSTGRKLGLRLAAETAGLLSNPARLPAALRTASAAASAAAAVLGRLTVLPPDPSTPFKGRLGTRKRAAWSDPLPLETIKAVGRAIGNTTVNDVLIAAVTGAMRHYLKTRHTRVNELDLRVMVPINIRRPGTERELGNKFGTAVLQLPVYIEDPILRLREVRRRMDLIKRSPEPYVVFGTLSALGFLPAGLSKQAAHFFASKASGVLTNVPGPREPLFFAGGRIDTIMFWVPRSADLGLGISILSYAGSVTLGVASDEKLMPDPEVLLQGFELELAALQQRVRSGRIDNPPLVLHDRYREGRESAERAGAATAAAAARPRCRAQTRNGERCRRPAMASGPYCGTHARLPPPCDPEAQSAGDGDRRLEALAGLITELND